LLLLDLPAPPLQFLLFFLFFSSPPTVHAVLPVTLHSLHSEPPQVARFPQIPRLTRPIVPPRTTLLQLQPAPIPTIASQLLHVFAAIRLASPSSADLRRIAGVVRPAEPWAVALVRCIT
jgi:hypothetical protein